MRDAAARGEGPYGSPPHYEGLARAVPRRLGAVGAGVRDPLLGSRIATLAGPVSGHGDRGRSAPLPAALDTQRHAAAEHQQRSYQVNFIVGNSRA